MHAQAAQVLAFRLARQGLAAPAAAPVAGPGDVLRAWTVQDSPPGAAAAAVAVRAPALESRAVDAALEERSAVALYNPRTATAVLPAQEAPAFAAALVPSDDDGLRAVLLHAVPGREEDFAAPVDLAVEAIADALDGCCLSRDELHEELRRRLPPELLPWCPGCGSHHARRGLLVMASLRGRLCLAGRAGRQPRFARTDQWIGWTAERPAGARGELVRRYLRAYGPSSPAHLAEWAGIARTQAGDAWRTVEAELERVSVDGAPAGWVLAEDAPALADPPPAPGIRLLAPGDPLLLGRDRAALVPDAAVRGRLWRPAGGPGLALADGRPVALWRGRVRGPRLEVSIEPFAGPLEAGALQAEADRVARVRGRAAAAVTVAA
jgi:hypothetical protein